MLRIISFVMTIILTIAIPPIAIITVPVLVIVAFKTKDRVDELKGQRDTFLRYQAEQERLQAIQRFKRL